MATTLFKHFDDENSDKLKVFAVLLLLFLFLSFLVVFVIGPQTHSGSFLETGLYISLQLMSLYIFYQILDFAFQKIFASHKLQIYRTGYFSEFIKFFIAFWFTRLYVVDYLAGYTPSNILNAFFGTSIYSGVSSVFLFKFRQIKDMALKSKLAQAEAQYNLLESQMQPHFLFNSLNVLSELIYVDPNMAVLMTQKLADLYRDILHNSKNKFSSLASEIAIIEKYLDIQKIRFGDRIKFSTNINPELANHLQIPSLILQTLVENSIKHGISPLKEGGEIGIEVTPVKNNYEICVWNTGELYKSNKPKISGKSSTGLQNTINRLNIIYGSQEHDFKIYSDANKTYVKFLISGGIA